ncbi:MAG TPA: SRPBCC family protein [Acidobacteriaceae bacterium]|nr:SRPBCC family protein [Acidobacteriaceae bacterium]
MKDRQIMTTRIVSAEREEVWQAWTNPILLAQWWGPRGFRNTFYEFDLRPGGAWRFIMHSPDGAHFPNESVFVEIVQPERIVFRHLAPVRGFLATAEFAKEGAGTAIRFSMLFPTVAECARSRRYAEQGNEENFDRLEALLAVTV